MNYKCGFTVDHYKESLQLAKDKGYEILPIRDYSDKRKKAIYLRHDIDWSLENAYELANIEYDLGIKSSYFVYLHAETYNALSAKGMGMIRSIYDMGHEIGLHTEGTNYVQDEHRILEYIFRGNVFNYAFHLPALRERVEGFKYLKNVAMLPIKYISDSGRNWREGCMCQWIGRENKLQVLTHAEWWVSNSKDMTEGLHKLFTGLEFKLARDIQEIKQLLHEYYTQNLKKENII